MKKIVIVIDLQNGFVRNEQTREVSRKIRELLDKRCFDSIIATRFINREDSQYTNILNWHRLMDSPDIDLVDGIMPNLIVDKYIYTCVNDKFIEKLKTINDGILPEKVFIVGVDTDCCVLKTAVDLFEAGIQPIVLLRYCASNGGPHSHEAGITVMKRLIGNACLIDEEISDLSGFDF